MLNKINLTRERASFSVRDYLSSLDDIFNKANQAELLVLLYKSISSILSRGGTVSSTVEFCTQLTKAIPCSSESEILDIISDPLFESVEQSIKLSAWEISIL